MKTIITYYSAQENLAVLLTLLQAQLVLLEEIIIIDTSPTKTGLDVAMKFNTNSGIKITVECARVGIYEAWNRGIDLAGESDVVIMNDDLIIPINFTDVLGLVSVNTNAYCIVPNTPPKEHYKNRVDLDFGFYAKLPETKEDLSFTDWMSGFCFFLKKECIKEVGLFDDKHFKVWFGDDDYQNRIKKEANKNNVVPILKIDSMFVYHYGGKSYEYQSKEVQKLINKDRKYYAKKYPEEYKKLVAE
jgi:GT2 family glycosyltransferase